MTHGNLSGGSRGLAVGSEEIEGVAEELSAHPELRAGLGAIREIERFNGSAPREWATGPLAEHRAAVLASLGHRVTEALEAADALALSPRALRALRSAGWPALRVVIATCGLPRIPSKQTTPRERLDPKAGDAHG